jgi:transcriptional regulator with XRE-family HTH domain
MKLDTQMQFAHNIKSLRLHKSMSQLDMAKEFNLSRTSYAQYESGSRVPDMATLIEMSDFFGIKMDALLTADNKTLIGNMLLYNSMTHIEHELLTTFASLSDYSKGRLLERAYILHEEEKEFFKELNRGKGK